jgi:hypothetical protein
MRYVAEKKTKKEKIIEAIFGIIFIVPAVAAIVAMGLSY